MGFEDDQEENSDHVLMRVCRIKFLIGNKNYPQNCMVSGLNHI